METLISFGIFVTTLFWWPTAPVPFEVPKVIFFQYFVKILSVVFVFSFLNKYKKWNINRKITLLVLIFVLWTTFASIIGVDVAKSFVGNYYRKDGLLTLYHLIGFSFLVSFFWKENLKRKISLVFFISSLILSILAIFEIITHKFGLGSAATFGNPNFLAGYLAVSLPFSFYLFKERGVLITALAITLIGANSAILTLILFLILIIKGKYKYFLIGIMVVIASFITFYWARNYYLGNLKVFITEGRVRIYRNIWKGFTKRPLIGYGLSNVDYAFDNNVWPLKFSADIYVDKAHSEFLEILTTTGIPGFTIYIVLILLLFRRILFEKDKLWRFTLLSILILYLFHSQTNVISIGEQIIFWLVAGICLTV